MTDAWSWWTKSKATVFPACNSWLNFRFRSQFEMKILIVRQKCTTYFIRIFKKIKLEPAIIWLQKILDFDDGSIHEPAIRSSDTGQRIPCFDSCKLLTTLMSNMCAVCALSVSCALKLARKYEIEHCSRSSKTINWSADSFQIDHVTSMSWHMSPRYGHVIPVSGYPVLTAVNWPFWECPIYKMSLPFDSLPIPPLQSVDAYVRSVNHVTTKRKELDHILWV